MSNACFGINDWRNRVFEEALSPKAKLVALALAKYYRQGKECYPSYSVLRDDTGYTNNHTIITAIEELKEAGLIKVKKGGVKCLSMQAHSYEFIGVSTGEVTGEVTGEIFSPQEDNKGIREEDNLKNSKKSFSKNKKVFPEEFEKFWQEYPKDRAGSKEKAYTAYCRVLKEGRATSLELVATAKQYAKSREVADGFAKGCAAWFNDDRFLIDYEKREKPYNPYIPEELQ